MICIMQTPDATETLLSELLISLFITCACIYKIQSLLRTLKSFRSLSGGSWLFCQKLVTMGNSIIELTWV